MKSGATITRTTCVMLVAGLYLSPVSAAAQSMIGGKSSLPAAETAVPQASSSQDEGTIADPAAKADLLAIIPEAVAGDAPVTCLLSPARVSNISSPITGVVAEVVVKRTDLVQEGQVLVQLDDRLVQSDLDLARISMMALQEKLTRSERLVETRVISRDEIEAMRADFASAKAQVARAEVMVEMSRITAPFAGVVALADVEKGETLSPAPIIQVIDINTLNAELDFPRDAFGKLHVGQTLTIGVDLVARTVPAVITAVDPFLDASSNTFSVLAEIDNRDLALPAGANCRLEN